MKRAFLTTVALLALACPAGAQTPGPVATPEASPAAASAAAPAEASAEAPKWDVQNPPGPSRDIPIDVTRGTWMSLDVSPDGQTIVFDLLGDIYVMPVSGG